MRLDPTKPVDRQTGHHCGEKGSRVVDGGGVSRSPAQPGVLDDVVGVDDRTEDAVADPEQSRPLLLECGQCVVACGVCTAGLLVLLGLVAFLGSTAADVST